ncbi:MAG: hypothetical protein ABI165_14635 [Bryobacteraceae bacterium]
MSSEAQLNANRANSQLSTGPKTETGKEASKKNAFRHGLTSQLFVLPGEDVDAFEQLHTDAVADFSPIGLAEELLVFDLTFSWWRVLRTRRTQAAFLARIDAYGSPAALSDRDTATFLIFQRYVSQAENAWNRTLTKLQQTQMRRQAAAPPASPKATIGSVSQNPYPRPAAPPSTPLASFGKTPLGASSRPETTLTGPPSVEIIANAPPLKL